MKIVALTLFLFFLVSDRALAFSAPQSLQIQPAVSLPRAIHHGLLLTFDPIVTPSLISFKAEVSPDNGTTWFLFQDSIRPYDNRSIILPYRSAHYGFATGKNYRIRLCANYGSEIQCSISSTFRLPSLSSQDSLDEDDDILTNIQEYNYGTDPRNPDSDNDQMADPFEVARNLDPNLSQMPTLSVDVTSLNFGAGDAYGTQPGQHKLFTITNRGRRVLRISNGLWSGNNPTQFRHFNKMLEVVEVPPNQSRTIAVDFLPQAMGPANAKLDILSDDIAHFPSSISASGVGVGMAHLKVESDPHLNFSSTVVGADSSPKTIVVSNPDSDRRLTVSAFTRQTLNFLVLPGRFILPPGKSRTVQVIFSPEWTGSYEGLLEVRGGNAADQNLFQVPLLAEALGAPSKMRLAATAINFSTENIGTESKRELVIFNDGSGALFIKKIDFGSDGSSSTDGFSLSSDHLIIPPNGSNRITIFFKPTVAKNYASQLCFVTNDSTQVSSLRACSVVRSVGPGVVFPNASHGIILSGVGQ
ncbi:MAG: choice-of-anchor D domain-containing protein [Deltaproteobacteria bacterium]|nr:choice-of-anchor D domain-containing protein [Deltaproteobacteria bacterium]